MKRIMMSAAVLALLATGCQNEVLVEQSQPQEGQLFTLEVGRGFESRTVLGTPNAEGTPTWWSEDDAIYVSGVDGKVSGVLKFVKFIDDDKTKAEFSGYVTGGQPTELKHIVFPVPEGGKTINMAARTPGKLDAPMIGTINGGVASTLKNVGGIIAFNSDKAYDVRAMNGNANMAAGTYTFDPTTGKLEYEPGTLNDVTPTYKSTDNSRLVYVPVATTTDPTDGTNNTELTGVTIDALQNGAVISSATVKVTSGQIVGDDNNESTLPAISAWDGEAIDIKWYNEVDSEFEINTAAQLAGLAKLVNEQGVTFRTLEGTSAVYKKIKLTSNIDLGGNKWTPIGYGTTKNDPIFKGIFDGQNYIISNYTIEGEEHLGLFGSFSYGKLLNLNVKNVSITGYKYAGALIGWAQNGATKNDEDNISVVENCSAEKVNIILTPNKDMEDGKHAGGLVGYAVRFKITECVIDGFDVEAYHSCGGLLGTVNGSTCIITNNIVKNGTVTANQAVEDYKDTMKDTYKAGEVVGSELAYKEIEPNTIEKVTVKTIKKD